MSDSPENYEIFHAGVKGMKWGVRKAEVSKSSSKKSGPKNSSDHTEVTKLRTKPLSSLSNDQLRKINKRLDLEQNYSRLTKTPGKLEKGHNKVKAMLAFGATGVAIYNLANHPGTKAGISLVKKSLSKNN